MSLTLRKLAMLEKSFAEREEAARIDDYTSCPVDKDLEDRVKALMEKVRTI